MDHGERIIVTKGDANPSSIPGVDHPITVNDYIGKVVYVLFHH
jgi:signal peptidase I